MNDRISSEKEVLTIDEAAVLLRVHSSCVREYIRQGRLPALQLVPGGAIRISRKVIFDMLQEGNYGLLA